VVPRSFEVLVTGFGLRHRLLHGGGGTGLGVGVEVGADRKERGRGARGLSFDGMALLDWTTAMVRQDRRKDFGENRFQALVEGADGKPCVVVFTMRDETMWIISFCRARNKEKKRL
jgi:uncharacterized DUF497 family protein